MGVYGLIQGSLIRKNLRTIDLETRICKSLQSVMLLHYLTLSIITWQKKFSNSTDKM